MSNIEWTDSTWNPVIGCAKIAAGCKNCYAETMSKRLAAMGQKDYASILTPDGRFNGKAITRPDTLAEPLRWRKPRMVFVNSMSDLFHEDIPFEFIAAVFGVMAACPQHTFQVLTKRPERALAFFEWLYERGQPRPLYCVYASQDRGVPPTTSAESYKAIHGPWPLKNVWLGVSIATQADADKNIPVLLQCPAAVRFVSAEPLIGPVKFADVPGFNKCGQAGVDILRDFWVIVGCESGPGARGHFDYESNARSIIQQCSKAGVACFHKQLPVRKLSNIGYRVSHDPAEWPEDLRVREFPEVRA